MGRRAEASEEETLRGTEGGREGERERGREGGILTMTWLVNRVESGHFLCCVTRFGHEQDQMGHSLVSVLRVLRRLKTRFWGTHLSVYWE